MLYQINHDAKRKLWCGPAAIALVTGRPTSEIYAHADADAGRTVQGMYNSELTRTLRRLGYRVTLIWQVFGNGRMNLRQWAIANGRLAAGRPAILQVGNHYGVVIGRRYVDNQTRDPIALRDSDYLRSFVHCAWVVERVTGAAVLPPAASKAPASSDGAKARRLAKKHGIVIEKNNKDSWWVTCPAWGGEDPHEGNQFATSPSEVLAMVEGYIELLTARRLEGVTAPLAPAPTPTPVCPAAILAAVKFTLQRDGADTAMGIACTLSVFYGHPVTERQVRGASLSLIREGCARWWRKRLMLLPPATIN